MAWDICRGSSVSLCETLPTSPVNLPVLFIIAMCGTGTISPWHGRVTAVRSLPFFPTLLGRITG